LIPGEEVVAHPGQHCDRERLRLLLQATLPAEQETDMVRHLDGCRDCQQMIEALAAEPAWWEELRHMPAANGALLGQLSLPFLDGPQSPTCPAGEGVYLGFLDPVEGPECLGRLGPFTITGVLGQGGMGIVLEAFDSALDRRVAIKVLSPHLASNPAARHRFAREARAAAAIAHPHVVPIFGVDSWKGLPYLVMAHVAGRSLQERLTAEGPLPLEEVLRIGMESASGLAAAHDRGLVHRDVKPANILLEGTTGRVLLTDFGLARAVDDAGLTQSGIIPGTPQYMAPEQARGEGSDHRADLFSLGSTLYAMCTGQAPFGADAPLAVLRRVCSGRPRPVLEVAPATPEWLAGIIDKLHAMNPADRFASAGEVADLLGKCLAHVRQPRSVPLPSLPGIQRRRRGIAGRLGFGLILAGAAALLAFGPPRRDAEPERSPVPQQPPPRINKAAPSARRLDDRPLDQQLQELQQEIQSLERELKTPAADPPDGFAARLLELHRRLESLQRERDPMTLP
jgi:serine/threonine protein kinase